MQDLNPHWAHHCCSYTYTCCSPDFKLHIVINTDIAGYKLPVEPVEDIDAIPEDNLATKDNACASSLFNAEVKAQSILGLNCDTDLLSFSSSISDKDLNALLENTKVTPSTTIKTDVEILNELDIIINETIPVIKTKITPSTLLEKCTR